MKWIFAQKASIGIFSKWCIFDLINFIRWFWYWNDRLLDLNWFILPDSSEFLLFIFRKENPKLIVYWYLRKSLFFRISFCIFMEIKFWSYVFSLVINFRKFEFIVWWIIGKGWGFFIVVNSTDETCPRMIFMIESLRILLLLFEIKWLM